MASLSVLSAIPLQPIPGCTKLFCCRGTENAIGSLGQRERSIAARMQHIENGGFLIPPRHGSGLPCTVSSEGRRRFIGKANVCAAYRHLILACIAQLCISSGGVFANFGI
jgi:hypothetical protein